MLLPYSPESGIAARLSGYAYSVYFAKQDEPKLLRVDPMAVELSLAQGVCTCRSIWHMCEADLQAEWSRHQKLDT